MDIENKFKLGVVFSENVFPVHLEIWLPYLKRIPFPICIFCHVCPKEQKEKIPFPVFAQEDGFVIADAGEFPELEYLLYPVNRHRNFDWLRYYPHLKHIHIGHGDSDKAGSYSRIANAYDFSLMSDYSAYERYLRAGVDLAIEKSLFMGVPTLEGLEFAEEPVSEVRKILYAPTFEGNMLAQNYSSLKKIHKKLFAGEQEIIFRPHGAMGKRDPSYKELMLSYPISTLSKVEQFNQSDIIISDISGITSEYLFTGKPIVIPATPEELEAYGATHLSAYCYIWNYKKTSLSSLIKTVTADKKRKKRLEYRNKKFRNARTFDDSFNLFMGALQFAKMSKFQRKWRNSLYAFRYRHNI